jgi:phospholipid-translocating ATPase
MIQSFLIHNDIEMYDENLQSRCNPKAWNLCDDLGQIEYIFSDKTGTLTSNIMDFKKASINGIQYGKWKDPNSKSKVRSNSITSPDIAVIADEKLAMMSAMNNMFDTKYIDKDSGFVDVEIPRHIAQNEEQGKRIREFFSLLALCHTVLVEENEIPNDISYRAQSPDESALVNAAKNVGFACLHRSENKVELDIMGELRTYTVLNVMEFNSDRKRMSVIVERPEGDIVLLCKGADSVIYERLDVPASFKIMQTTSSHLEEFANDGLRTLCLSFKILDKAKYEKWNSEYRKASALIEHREAKCDALAEEIETEMILMGATAIEDKLQDGVPESISLLAKAGIKIWVLTVSAST